jgi:hypothetical protein
VESRAHDGTLNVTMRPRVRTILVRSAQVLGGLVVGLVLTELIFRWRADGAFPHLNVYKPDAELGVRLIPGRETRIAFGGNPATDVRINRDGYRGANLPAPAAGRDEILVVGDSQVFGLGVEEGQTFSARLGAKLGKGALVINGGVPTYGPAEYKAVVAEYLARRPVKTVVFTINMVNDLFENGRPNRDRHAVWDGWAVRRESSPGSVTWFPGRDLLFNRSHAFFALRRWWHSRGPALDDRGFASEGTWSDVMANGDQARTRHAADAKRLEERNAELVATASDLNNAEDELVGAALRASDYDNDAHFQLRAARANPGDIVEEGSPYAEASRGVHVTAEQIRKGVAFRKKLEAEMLAKARAKGDQKLIAAFETRDKLERQLALLDAAPELAAFESPLAPVLREVKALCDAKGARLVVLVLPIDVQVSADEWKKYGQPPRDMEPTLVIIDDVLASAAAIGVTAVDATRPLHAVQPGAFLKRDIHMTPKGHQAVADALAEAIATPPPAPRTSVARADRSAVPIPSAWRAAREINVRGSTKANCETKRIREWLRIACRRDGNGLEPRDITVVSGDAGEAMIMLMPGATTLLVPVERGRDLVVDFGWHGHTQRLTSAWPADAAQPAIAFADKVTRPLEQVNSFYEHRSATEEAICRCWRDVYGETCNGVYGAPDPACVATYASCSQMLACVLRDPASPPGSGALPPAGPQQKAPAPEEEPPMQQRIR